MAHSASLTRVALLRGTLLPLALMADAQVLEDFRYDSPSLPKGHWEAARPISFEVSASRLKENAEAYAATLGFDGPDRTALTPPPPPTIRDGFQGGSPALTLDAKRRDRHPSPLEAYQRPSAGCRLGLTSSQKRDLGCFF